MVRVKLKSGGQSKCLPSFLKISTIVYQIKNFMAMKKERRYCNRRPRGILVMRIKLRLVSRDIEKEIPPSPDHRSNTSSVLPRWKHYH